MQTIQIHVGDSSFQATVFSPVTENANPKLPALILARGWPSAPQHEWFKTAQRLANASGTAMVLFDYSGANSNNRIALKETTIAGHQQEVTAIYDATHSLPYVDPRKISIYGNSYGAFFAAWLPSQRPVHGVRLSAPALYSSSVINLPIEACMQEESEDAVYEEALTEKNNPALASLRDFTGHFMLIEHEHDELIPHSIVNAYIKASNSASSSQYHIIKGAQHHLGSPQWKQQSEALTVNWLKKIASADLSNQ